MEEIDFYPVNISLSIDREDKKRLERIADSLNEENKKHGVNLNRYTWENVLKYFCVAPQNYLNDMISTLEYNRGIITQDEWNHRQETYQERLENQKKAKLADI